MVQTSPSFYSSCSSFGYSLPYCLVSSSLLVVHYSLFDLLHFSFLSRLSSLIVVALLVVKRTVRAFLQQVASLVWRHCTPREQQ